MDHMVDVGAHRRRAIRTVRQAAYLLTHRGRAGGARPVFIFGAQRSGTTMLLDRLRELPQIACYGETSSAFERAYLKDRDYVGRLIDRCRLPFIAFKPLTSSHEVIELLELRPSALALWVFRRPQDRAGSAVSLFGDDNLRALRKISAGVPIDTWHARGLSQASREIVASFDTEKLGAHDAAGLMWLIRNRLFFEQGLDSRDDVLPVCYEDLVTFPESVLSGICAFLGLQFVPRMAERVHRRSVGKGRVELDPKVDALCEAMYASLRSTTERQWQRLGLDAPTAQTAGASVG